MYEIRFSMMAEAVDADDARQRALEYLGRDLGGEQLIGLTSTAQVNECPMYPIEGAPVNEA